MNNLIFTVFFMCFLFNVHASSQNLVDNRSLSDEQWREDLQFLVEKIQNTHPNPFSYSSEDTFMYSTKLLYDKIPEMTDNEVIVELMRITSFLKDGHTRLHGKNLTKIWFPVRVYEFEDGYFITAINRDYSDAIGAKVIKIGKYTVDEAFEKIKEITPHENEYSMSYTAPMYLTMQSILYGLHIINTPNYLNITLLKDEKIFELNIPAIEFDSDSDLMWYWMFNSVPTKESARFIDIEKDKLPLVYRNIDQFYWFEYLEEFETVYFCFNMCLDSEDEKFSEFNSKLWEFIDRNNVKRLIIDLRNNIGGNNQIVLQLVHDIIRHDDINKKDSFFIVIGRKTWSAAMHCATWLEKHTNAIFIGEPTASAPNHYADPDRFTLPNSKIELLVSRYYWQNSWPWDERNYIEPEIIVKIHSHEYFGYHDPVLELLLNKLK